MTSIPSVNLTPWISFGNWLWPFVVGPDDVLDVGVGYERYDAVAPSGNGVGSEIDGGHYKSSSGPRFRLRASVPGPPQRAPMHAVGASA
jgi:hypothetical protein